MAGFILSFDKSYCSFSKLPCRDLTVVFKFWLTAFLTFFFINQVSCLECMFLRGNYSHTNINLWALLFTVAFSCWSLLSFCPCGLPLADCSNQSINHKTNQSFSWSSLGGCLRTLNGFFNSHGRDKKWFKVKPYWCLSRCFCHWAFLQTFRFLFKEKPFYRFKY